MNQRTSGNFQRYVKPNNIRAVEAKYVTLSAANPTAGAGATDGDNAWLLCATSSLVGTTGANSSFQPAASAPAAGTYGGLCTIAAGSGASQRLGNKIMVKSIFLKIKPEVLSIPTGSITWRVILFMDRQANGTFPVATDLLSEIKSNSFRNLENSLRFKVLRDASYELSPGAAFRGDALEISIPKVNEEVYFADSNSLQSSMKSTQFHVLVVRSSAVTADYEKARLLITARVRYIDP